MASAPPRGVHDKLTAYVISSAVENDDGYRCPEPRCRFSLYCDGHRCSWISADRVQCGECSYNNTNGACSVHMCVVEGCEKRAENNTSRCEDHVCAYCFINPESGAKGEFPYCYHPPAEPGPYCQIHQAYVDSWAAVVEFEQWRLGCVWLGEGPYPPERSARYRPFVAEEMAVP